MYAYLTLTPDIPGCPESPSGPRGPFKEAHSHVM